MNELKQNEKMKNELEINKINGDVAFNEEQHLYWNTRNKDLSYISITTIIGKYHEKFDEDFWSSYKAIERIVGIEEFKGMSIKRMLLDVKCWKDEYLKFIDIDKDLFFETKAIIQKEYKDNKDAACERGTAYHLMRENQWYENKQTKVVEYIDDDTVFDVEKNNWDLNRENAILPEYLVYYSSPDGLVNLAGQIDLLIKEGNNIYVLDFKTNSKGIDKKAYFNNKTKQTKKMYYPINNIEDTTYNHYALQLSFYAYMLKQINKDFVVKKLQLLHNSGSGETKIDVPFYENEVKKIIADLWKKNNVEREKQILVQINDL